jgi:hypothetical protein
MKDITSTSFGLVIAYLLPGFAAFFALCFWSPPIQDLFSKFLVAESSVGSFLLVLICSLTAGLEVSIFRWILFEKVLCKSKKLDRTKFAHLSVEAKLTAFRAAVDEHYRYHQFWGGMAFAIPFIGVGIVNASSGSTREKSCLGIAFLIVEVVTIIAARSAFNNYIDRAANILEGFVHAERMGETPTRRRRETEAPATTSPATAATAATAASASASATNAPAREMIQPGDDDSCGVTQAGMPNA